jgi:NADH-quinone oxidoreductase subunit C
MDPDLLRAIQDLAPGARIEPIASLDSQSAIRILRNDVPSVTRALRDHQDLRFTLLVELTAVDLWPREPRFEVVYTVVSIERRLRLRVKVALQGGSAEVATVSDVWPAANWLEREVWDLFGIAFTGHPDPRRLLMPDDWEGHPLRKDYPVQVRAGASVGMPLQVTEEEFRANLERDRQRRS